VAVCSSGISAPKPGVNASVIVDAAYVQSLLPAGLAWLYPYLPYMHGLEIGDVGAFCSVDPPTFTVPTAAEIFNFITGNSLEDVIAVSDFMQAITKMYLWYSLCHCTTVATPSAPSPPAAPADLPAINPPGVITPSPTAGCLVVNSPTVTTTSDEWHDLIGHDPVQAGEVSLPNGPTRPLQLPAGALTVTMTGHNLSAHAGGPFGGLYTPESEIRMQFFDAADAFISGVIHTYGALTDFTHADVPVPSGARGVQVSAVNEITGQNHIARAELTVYCAGAPAGAPVVPCCPPDPILTGRLDSILKMVTLIQRQHVPFATLPGPAHTGLSGDGQFGVQGITSLAVHVTTVPGRVGVVAGEPDTIYDVGWLRVGTIDGWGPRIYVSSQDFLVAPVAGDVVLVGYSIPADVVWTINERVREI
jgi:hypothetical protein